MAEIYASTRSIGSSGELQVLRYPELRERRIPINPVSLFFAFKTSLVTDPPNEK